uniref:Uncharacterized protein n=1 Tax=Periophthalmus magnuspinnatus TaxID=409849 RepID=A0A3B4B367_9GOBI
MSGTPGSSGTAKMKKDESFLGKLGGTLVRKKKSKEGKWILNVVPLCPWCCNHMILFENTLASRIYHIVQYDFYRFLKMWV